ncbi:MAG: HD domain-containing protein [Candidatus Lokiarchaeota archaeon]|nr:HD domain-containing protein [Candidatus Lokiarchaeota archaeon]
MNVLESLSSEIEEFAKKNMTDDILHGWPHVRRVLKYASLINEELKGDWIIIKNSILLHDIGHKINRQNHNQISAEMAQDFLKSKNVEQEKINKISQSILTHSRQFSGSKPLSLEAKIVYDADGMDLFGPIGLMRALLSCALMNKEFDCMIKKLEWRMSEIKNFYSDVAKKFVTDNETIIKTYLNQLKIQLKLFE